MFLKLLVLVSLAWVTHAAQKDDCELRGSISLTDCVSHITDFSNVHGLEGWNVTNYVLLFHMSNMLDKIAATEGEGNATDLCAIIDEMREEFIYEYMDTSNITGARLIDGCGKEVGATDDLMSTPALKPEEQDNAGNVSVAAPLNNMDVSAKEAHTGQCTYGRQGVAVSKVIINEYRGTANCLGNNNWRTDYIKRLLAGVKPRQRSHVYVQTYPCNSNRTNVITTEVSYNDWGKYEEPLKCLWRQDFNFAADQAQKSFESWRFGQYFQPFDKNAKAIDIGLLFYKQVIGRQR